MQSDETPESKPVPRPHVLTLPVLLAIGWVIYEVTAQPGLAAVVMCIKFGWEDFRTARWLRHLDPDRRRGWACFWLYLSSCLWKVALTSGAMILLIVLLVAGARLQPRGAEHMLAGAAITLVLGFGLSAITCFWALYSAWKNDIRLWLNGSVSLACARHEWPPLYGRVNRVLVLALTSVVVTCMVLIPFCLAILLSFLGDLVDEKSRGGAIGVGAFASVMLLMPLLALKVHDLRKTGFFANHPEDCWGADAALPEGDIDGPERYNRESYSES